MDDFYELNDLEPALVSNSPDTAVKLGMTTDAGMDLPNTNWSFCYNFVDSNRDTWEQNKSDSMASIGPLIGANGGMGEVVVRMNEDTPFRMLWMKFNVYHKTRTNLIEWYESDSMVNFFLDPYFNQSTMGIPMHQYIRARLTIASPDGRILYGDKESDGITSRAGLMLPISTLQGYDYGMGQLYQPYLLPKQGVITIDLLNTHPSKALYVGGAIFGEKVRI